MSTDETDNGWDSLAEDLGIESPPPPPPKAEKPTPTSTSRASHRAKNSHRDPRPEIEQEAEDFASGLTSEPPSRAALYDPGPETVVDHAADLDETIDPSDDGAEGDEPAARDEEESEEGGKRRRRRRRRKKKSGAPEGTTEEATEEESAPDDADEDATTVEEGEAPGELEGDDDDEEMVPSAGDEEMDAEAAQPRPEWHVMSWAELVSKLHRPT